MAENATLNQVAQIGVETTSGTAVAANKQLQSVSIEPSIKANIKSYRPSGGKFNTVSVLGKEWSEAKISGPMTYTEMSYLCSGNIAYAAPAQQSSTIAYLWTHTPAQNSADTIKTFTIEHGSAVRARKSAYGLINSLGYKITRDECTFNGSVLAKAITDGITLTASPTAIEIVPVLPTQVCVYADAASGDLGTTKLTRIFGIEWEYSERFAGVWPIDCALTSFAAHVETAPKPSFKLFTAADSEGMAFLDKMRTGEKTFIRVQAVGDEIVSGQDYTWTHDICAVLMSEPSEFRDEGGVYGLQWNFEADYDATWGKAFVWSEKNKLTGL